MEGQPRIVLAAGEVDVRITLVVAQQDVVARLERLDQLRFQQQRLALGARHGDFHARDLRHHRGDARLHPRLQEIAADALLQVAGLAHVQQLATGVEMPVDAGRGGERLDEGLAVERWRWRWWCGLHASDSNGAGKPDAPALSSDVVVQWCVRNHSSARSRSASVSTPGGNGSGVSRTAIPWPCSSTRNCSSDSVCSSGVRDRWL